MNGQISQTKWRKKTRLSRSWIPRKGLEFGKWRNLASLYENFEKPFFPRAVYSILILGSSIRRFNETYQSNISSESRPNCFKFSKVQNYVSCCLLTLSNIYMPCHWLYAVGMGSVSGLVLWGRKYSFDLEANVTLNNALQRSYGMDAILFPPWRLLLSYHIQHIK